MGSKEAGGRRLYSEEDLLRLEKIMLLKSLSLPLSDIQSLLDELSIRQILKAHQKLLENQLAQLQ
ncbi:MerR family transcriptional regulator [Paenibacillus sp. MER TA 81-3]|uniref:MerR family transcriptional regulator n=1 Tax=Paenibacillus sp. MER TA 81-3 TaxID=2939573 RepID=UPI0020417C3C|nr:MerR family transcriptional regulator [Paenibacillus sp. MER TA 81-3]